MAVKKSGLYELLWKSCDELRGGMDASLYKDYVLSLLFIKYISDKYAGKPFATFEVPEGAGFADMAAMKGKPDIGEQINTKVVAKLAEANNNSLTQNDFPDFDSETKLGSGKAKVDRLTNLISIFQNPALDFSGNRAADDDILGDAYEYLMRHFAVESGKSKGQFYTPAEVSRVMAQVIGIADARVTSQTTVYDPTCGSGALLIRVGDSAAVRVTLYGQERDLATSGLARMNMIIHGHDTASIKQGNTLPDPQYLEDGGNLKTFDYVAANPPFSDKSWSNGLDPNNDIYGRFEGFGAPPRKQGDYAYLLHIVRSLKSSGRGACIMPHGVLFRGNAEAAIRRNLIRRGYIEGVIGLPANLFYGTGIPACIVVLDKAGARARSGVFMIDASEGFIKDGPKNRLRERDIHKIVDAFKNKAALPGYSRLVPQAEIEGNDYNLNLPRYINTQKAEDKQDIEGHLKGGVPAADVDALQDYWNACPNLKAALFTPGREGYFDLAVDKQEVRRTIRENPDFDELTSRMNQLFASWRKRAAEKLKLLGPGCKPKQVILELSEDLLSHYAEKPLIDNYAVYQHLMDYWAAQMQDDCYQIAAEGWKAAPEPAPNGNSGGAAWVCDLVPKARITARYFAEDQAALKALRADLETAEAQRAALEEDHSGEDGAFADLDKINKANVSARLKEIRGNAEYADEERALADWAALETRRAGLKKREKEADAALDAKAYNKYPELSENEVKNLVVDAKWLTDMDARLQKETAWASYELTRRIRTLAERYETSLPDLAADVANLEAKVQKHLERMGL